MAHISAQMRMSIDECRNCQGVCLETVMRGLEVGGQHAEAGLVGILLDCAEICETAAKFMLRGSDLHPRICGVCAEVCEECARACDGFTEDWMKQCVEACRSCAESCRRMAGQQQAAAA